MKKLLLLLAGSVAFTAGAQERHLTAAAVSDAQPVGKTMDQGQLSRYKTNRITGAAAKTTAGGSRWYNYALQYVDTTQKILSGGTNSVVWGSTSMWQDTNLVVQGTTATRNVNLVSVGSILDPHADAFNDSTYFEGLLKVTASNAYTVDSVSVSGVYRFNPAKTSVVDTVRLSFVKGNGGSEASDDIFSGFSSNSSHYGTVSFHDMHYDSVKNYARHTTAYGTPSDNVKDIILTSANWGDTLSNGKMVFNIQLPTALSVSAGGYAGMSISFISGDATRPTSMPFDTLQRSNGTFKYNVFEPAIDFLSDGTNVQWAPLPPATDHNAGYFKKQPTWANGWSETYLPQFAFFAATGGGAYFYQYPEIFWHVNCSTCGVITNNPSSGAVAGVETIKTVNAFPNPAVNELNVPFTLAQSANVTVSLSNLLGQVVVSQNMGKVTSGSAVINTAAIPNGVYFCTVSADGERNTSKIIIAH